VPWLQVIFLLYSKSSPYRDSQYSYGILAVSKIRRSICAPTAAVHTVTDLLMLLLSVLLHS